MLVGLSNSRSGKYHFSPLREFLLSQLRALSPLRIPGRIPTGMVIIPAIDLYENSVVRLHQGSYEAVTRYDSDPATVARGFVAAGASRIHLVDLSAARGSGSNTDAIRAIRSAVDCTLELGGGVRTLESARILRSLGLDYLVTGTSFARDPDEVSRWIDELGPVIIAGIDARDGRVKVAGWEEDAGIDVCDLAARAKGAGIAAIEYTNIAKDGAFTGPDLDGTLSVAACSDGVPVIASGGVRNAEDIRLASARTGIAGIIIGRALYESRIDLAEVIRTYGTGGAS